MEAVTNTVTGQATRFLYDGDGNRVKRVEALTTTVYLGSLVEIAIGPGGRITTTTYYLGGQRVALRQGGAVIYLHADHLGSISLATDGSGLAIPGSRTGYLPFGGERFGGSGLPTDRRFTGQRNEAALGSLYDYGARFYSPALGRFISADTIVPGPGNPQALNRYSYVFGNALRYSDPSGHSPCDDLPSAAAQASCQAIYDAQQAPKLPPTDLSISDEGIAFILGEEQIVLHLYNSVNDCTVGAGCLVHHGPCTYSDANSEEKPYLKLGDLSQEDALTLVKDLFKEKLDATENALRRDVTVPLTQFQYDALVSFMFNAGDNALVGYYVDEAYTMTFADAINQGDNKAFLVSMQQVVYSNYQIMPGLVDRRQREFDLFLIGVYHSKQIVIIP